MLPVSVAIIPTMRGPKKELDCDGNAQCTNKGDIAFATLTLSVIEYRPYLKVSNVSLSIMKTTTKAGSTYHLAASASGISSEKTALA